MPDTLLNQQNGFIQPVAVGRRRRVFPFYANNDLASTVTDQDFIQRSDYWIPPRLGVDRDPSDPLGYCINPAVQPSYDTRTGLVRSMVRYARIPAQQVSYLGPRYITMPSVPNTYGTSSAIPAFSYPVLASVGSGYYNQDAAAIYTDYLRSLYGAVKTCGNKTPGYATAGTFTLTFGANTTAALNWNDSGATIATAVNGLASMSGKVVTVSNLLNTVTGGSLLIQFTTGQTLTAITMNSSLTLTAANQPTTQISSNVQQDILMADNVTITAHGLDTSKSLAIVKFNGDQMIIAPTAYWGSVDANTIWTSAFGVSNPQAYVATFKQTYFPGRSVLVRTRLTEDFFLPGVSAGIATPSDITVTMGLQNPTDFINALLTLTGWQTYETEGPAFWLNGPIYRRAYTAIKLEDLVF
jgi:hypothetical protein